MSINYTKTTTDFKSKTTTTTKNDYVWTYNCLQSQKQTYTLSGHIVVFTWSYLSHTQKHINVTECTCALCLCCCTLCVSLSVFFRVSTSFDLLRMCYVFWFRRHYKTEWESVGEKCERNNNDLSYIPSKRKEEIKSRTSGCGSFVVPYFQPATSTDPLHKETN